MTHSYWFQTQAAQVTAHNLNQRASLSVHEYTTILYQSPQNNKNSNNQSTYGTTWVSRYQK